MTLLLAIVLALLLVGTAPIWPHSAHWGYYPSGGIGLLFTVFAIYLISQGAISITLALFIVLALLLVGTIPIWPHSVGWGYYPSSGLGLILAILVIYYILQRV